MKEIGPNRAAARNASNQRDEALKRARKTQLKAERMECDRRNGFSLDGDLPSASDVAAAWREHDEAIKDVAHWSERERINWDAVERGAE